MANQNYSTAIMGPGDNKSEEKVPSTEEFLDALNRDEMLEYFRVIDARSYKKAIRMARHLINKFIKEDPQLGLLRAFFILTLFNTEDYTLYREAYNYAVKISPGCQIKLADVYHASMVLDGNKDYEKRINALAPYVKEIVDKMVSDVREVRARIKSEVRK